MIPQLLAAVIVIANVTVVDVEAGAHRLNQTVVVEGDRIVAADDAMRVRVPKGARIIPGKGKFLIPGLWDMHVHDFPNPQIPEMFVANGVTGVRDMYDDPTKLREVRRAIEEHRRIGPRVVASGGPTLNGINEKNKQTVVRTAEQARRTVQQRIKDGGDFIKIYNALPREAVVAIADECKRNRIPFVGHTPDALTTMEAAALGERSIEHLDSVLLDCSWDGARLRREGRFTVNWPVLKTFHPSSANRAFAAYVQYGTWHCPTLTIFRAETAAELRSKMWKDEALDRAILQKMMEVTAMMFRAGVKLLAGTDTGNPHILPGSGLHDEIELMVSAGIPDAAVLRIATLGAAQFLGREQELGSVSRGKLADLVLLDADPLQSIANTRRISVVVADGVLVTRNAIPNVASSAKRAKPATIPPSRR